MHVWRTASMHPENRSETRCATVRVMPTMNDLARRIFRSVHLFALPALVLFAFDNYDKEAKKLGDLMSWKPGEVIAEIGAGEGQMLFAAAVRAVLAGEFIPPSWTGQSSVISGRRSLAESCRM